ncbi:MAG: penicillin-binding protein 2 [Proteobacteria bacterium]|nr:penicillin-binding protein 2 [Pseudomonadota bacterium]
MARLGADPTGSPPDRRVRVGPRSGLQALDTGHVRLVVVGGFLALIFLSIAARLVILASPGAVGLHGSDAAGAAVPLRGDIVDRNGVVLATSLAVASLFADPNQVLDAAGAADALAPLLSGMDRDDLLSRLTSDRDFVWLARHLTPRQQADIHNLGIPGIDFRFEQRRVYPHGALTGHVVGFADVDDHGLAGVEKGMDDELRAGGGALRLSVDIRVQHVLHDELARAMQTFDAVAAAGTVIDVATGEILAQVSLPDFDPNRVTESSADARFNRATLGVYEPGSTFKILTAAMALEYATATLDEKFDATGPLRVDRFTVRDTHPENRWLTMSEVFIYSSNVGAARIAMEIGPERQRAFLERLGLLRRPQFELAEVGAPIVPRPWGEVSMTTIAYGHGIAVSQLHLAAAYAAIVNGGLRVEPTLRAVDRPVAGERVLSRATSDALGAMLRLNVLRGTGRQADAEGFVVGGKTGTAEKAVAGGYNTDALISSFVAAFPMDAPRYAVLVMLDEPKGNEATAGFATAGWTAAPATAAIIARIAPLLGVAPRTGGETERTRALMVSLPDRRTGRAAF